MYDKRNIFISFRGEGFFCFCLGKGTAGETAVYWTVTGMVLRERTMSWQMVGK